MLEGKITYLQEDSTESSLKWKLDKDIWLLTLDRADGIQCIQMSYSDIDALIAMHLFKTIYSLNSNPEKSSEVYYMALEHLTMEMRNLKIERWDNDEGYDVSINDEKISLSFTDIGVLQLLISSHNVQSLVLSNIEY